MIFALNVICVGYNKLPDKQAETQPWDMLCLDLIDNYQITPKKGGRKYSMKDNKDKKDKKDKDDYLQAITMMDPATGWIEIRYVLEARADLNANEVDLSW